MEHEILDSLEQLGYTGPLLEEKALLQAAVEGLSSPEYVQLCRWLAAEMRPLWDLEENISSDLDDLDGLRVELSGFLRELHCPHEEAVAGILKGSEENPKNYLKFLLFLSSELQAAQMVSARQARGEYEDRSLVYRELSAICETLQLTESQLEGEPAEVLARVLSKVEESIQDLPDASIGKPALEKLLSEEQWEKLGKLNQVLSSEYECRRRMLIKRLDVTIQSFGWSDRAKVRVDSMASAYQPRRHALEPQSTVGLAELLAARDDICNVVKTSSGASREKTICDVNKVLMGRVPDRGGRPSEISAPPPEMPPWKKRQDGGGRGGGGWGGQKGGSWGQGGWRGGGKGSGNWGGGGGWKGGHGQHGDYGGHGGKRGRYQY